MKKMLILFVAILISGCAVPTYKKPLARTPIPSNEIIVNKSFEEVWVALIEYASKSFFAIKHFEKDSGLLTLNFGSGNPSKFVDCGEINSPNINYEGPYINAVESTGYVNLDGAMNIFVKPIDKSKTKVSVNVRYILSAKDGPLPKQTWSFDSYGEQTRRTGVVSVTCRPTLEAEREILSGITLLSGENN